MQIEMNRLLCISKNISLDFKMFCENDFIEKLFLKFIDCTLDCLYHGMDLVRADVIYNLKQIKIRL